LLYSQNGGGKQPIMKAKPGILLGKTWTVAQKPSETKDGYKYHVGTEATRQPSTPIIVKPTIYIYIYI
jgi:hypothetical protein